MNRNQQIIRTSVVGIAANLFLAAFKAVAGWVAGSVAIVMDAVNNPSRYKALKYHNHQL